ncbi:hypothetical protein HHX38_08440 [Streptomyces sp. PKU-MA01144]|uniref:hypothetical protein n=1 Tax=Streptomyces sp. PKU-MA01144 TaxID=2729138 RepID=UPI0014800F02|nr:hypothetical protein [Streptomyces sp. PKU-MA01144]NNJ04161.1 hypothetical protein [Streptomyces sp. PKU-MA01144]
MSHRMYPSVDRARRQLDRHGRTLTATPLSELSTVDLCTRATSRLGGPTIEEVAEVARRVQRSARTLGESMDKVRLLMAARRLGAVSD